MGMHSTYTATHYKDLNIDWQARAVTRHGEDILLTPQEFALLQVLFDHRGQAVSRGDLLHTAWGYPCIGITPANLSILKNNKAKAVRFSTLEALCKALDCQPADLLEYRPDET